MSTTQMGAVLLVLGLGLLQVVWLVMACVWRSEAIRYRNAGQQYFNLGAESWAQAQIAWGILRGGSPPRSGEKPTAGPGSLTDLDILADDLCAAIFCAKQDPVTSEYALILERCRAALLPWTDCDERSERAAHQLPQKVKEALHYLWGLASKHEDADAEVAVDRLRDALCGGLQFERWESPNAKLPVAPTSESPDVVTYGPFFLNAETDNGSFPGRPAPEGADHG